MEQKSFFATNGNRVLGALVLASLIVALLAFANNSLQESKYRFGGPTTIDVRGEGEVLAKPDIGSFSFSVLSEGENASEAQEKSAEAINAILAFLAEQGVEEKDIKTQYYNLNPKYTYEDRVCPFGNYCPPSEPVIVGYEVSQSVMVKVRDLEAAGALISGAGERGATNISSLQFTIDDQSTLEAEARALAIADAKAKAEVLAADLGLKIVRIAGFYEESGYGGYYPEAYAMASDMGMGGEKAMVTPSMPTGENTIQKNVNIVFEVR